MARRLAVSARSLSKYVFLYEYTSEAQRIYITSMRTLRVLLFFFLGSSLTALAVFLAYLLALGKLIFKGTILVAGLNLKISVFSQAISAVGHAVSDIFMAKWLYTYVFAPFGAFLAIITGFTFSLETLSVTCTGSSSTSSP